MQQAAYTALRNGLLSYESRQAFRGPERNIDLPTDPEARADAPISVTWSQLLF